MSDLRLRIPAQSLMKKTLDLHEQIYFTPSGDAKSWYTGALGEIAVAGVLAHLGPGWTVLHSVPIRDGEGDIDHVVIGPAGVFTINTKSHAGQSVWIAGYGLLISGQKTNYIATAQREAAFASERLSLKSGLTVPVTPILALVNPGPWKVKANPDGGVVVSPDQQLLQVIHGNRIFSDSQIEKIVSVAVSAHTWHQNPEPWTDPSHLAIAFNAIMARNLQGSTVAPMARAGRNRESVPWRDLSPRSRNTPNTRSRTPSSRRRGPNLGFELAKAAAGLFALWFFFAVLFPQFVSALKP